MSTTMDNPVRNGVDTAALFATIDAVKGDPDLANFQFRATNRWVSGTHNQSTIHAFYGAKQEMTHTSPWTYDADHPAVLVGEDHGPTPVEYLLHALAACLASGLANIAAARGVNLDEVDHHRRGRHRPARHPRPLRRRPQRLPADRGAVRAARRRPRQAPSRGGAVAPPLGGLRPVDQWRAGVDRGRCRMSERSERIIVAGSPRSGEQLTGAPLVGRLEPSRGHGARVRYDVVVVGARAAGAATALLLARAGLAVLLVDRAAYGSDTLSTARADARRRAAAVPLGSARASDRGRHATGAAGDVPLRRPGRPDRDQAIARRERALRPTPDRARSDPRRRRGCRRCRGTVRRRRHRRPARPRRDRHGSCRPSPRRPGVPGTRRGSSSARTEFARRSPSGSRRGPIGWAPGSVRRRTATGPVSTSTDTSGTSARMQRPG